MRLRLRRLIKQTKQKSKVARAETRTCPLDRDGLSPWTHLRRQTTQPSENSAVPFAGCSMPSGHSSFPGHLGSSEMAILLRYVPCSCFLWQASQKCVLPQQYHELT